MAGFDLLAEATGAGSDSGYAALLLNALPYVQPASVTPYAGAVVPLELTLTNQGIATPGVVTLTLPAGVTLVDSAAAEPQPDGTLTWAFDLAQSGVETLTVWVRLPDVVSTLTFTAGVQTGVAPDLRDYTTTTLELPMQPATTLTAVLAQIIPITEDTSRDDRYRQARTSLERAQTQLDGADFANTLKELLKAANDLMGIADTDAAGIRLQVDQVIRAVERRL